MENRYCFDVSKNTFGVRRICLDKNGRLVILYNQPNDKQEYDFIGEPEQAAREGSRRIELYNREHLEKIQDIEIDYLENGFCSAHLQPETKEGEYEIYLHRL